MASNTIIQQGVFSSDGTDKFINLRNDVDWVKVYNVTNIEASTQWAGTTWTWFRGMGDDEAITEFHSTASQIASQSTVSTGYNGVLYHGITLIDSSVKTPGAAVAVTVGTNATRPVYSTGDTGSIADRSIVRIQNTTQTNLNGLDFSVDTIVANTSFRLANTLATAPGIVAGAGGTYRFVASNITIYDMFKPKNRVIANITAANPGVVTTLVDHTYQTGQKVRIHVPAECGMIELDGKLVTVTRVSSSTFSIEIDTSAYTAFTFPVYTDTPFTPASIIPVGEDTSYNYLTDGALENTAYLGIILQTNADSAAIALGSAGGTANDEIYWEAGKSFSIIED